MIATPPGTHVVLCAALGVLLGCARTPAPAAPAAPASPAAPAQTAADPAPDPASPPADAAPPAPAEPGAVVIGRRKTLRSQILGEERTYLVYTPTGYHHGAAAYPVLYLLDGDAHFHHTTGLIDFLSRQQRMPEMIVVAIGNTDRIRDLTPTRSANQPTSGGADNFLAFLQKELMPVVERDYRTQPFRILVGHSLGGLFAVHALNRSPDTFDAYVSISPSLWWGDGLMRRNTEELLATRRDLTAFLYMTLGDEGEGMAAGCRDYTEMLRVRAPAGLTWTFTLLENEDHGSVPLRSTYRALEALFAGWRPPRDLAGAAAVEAHYAALSRRFGYDIGVPENVLNLLGYQLLGAGKNTEAMAVFQRNVALYPESANVYDSLGEAYERSGQRDRARENYAIAVRKATRDAHPFLAAYRRNLERVQQAASTAE